MYAKNIIGAALPALELLHGDNEIFEVRILVPSPDPKKKATYFGYFNSPELAYSALTEFTLSWSAAYCTLNTVDPALFANSPNKITRALRGNTTPDESIIRRKWIMLDFDPLRWPKNQPSTDEEKEIALETARNVARFCAFRGMPEPILADSGNGAHLLWKCDIPIESDVHKRMLIEIASKFNSPAVEVDLTIANPSRIWKIYGTLSRKGPSSEERKYRYSKILHIPSALPVLTEKDFRWLPPAGKESKVLIYQEDGSTKEYRSREAAKEERVEQVKLPDRKDGGGKPSDKEEIVVKQVEFDAEKKLAEWGLKTLPPFKKGDLTVYELDTCPCNRKLRDRSSALYVMGNGAAGFGCKHASCDYSESGGNRWKDLRNTYENQKPEVKNWRAKTSEKEMAEELTSANPKPKNTTPTKVSVPEKPKKLVFNDDDWAALGGSVFDDSPTKTEVVSDLDFGGANFSDDLDFGGILGELKNNPIIDEPPEAVEPEILRPLKANDKILRSPDGRRMVNVKDDYNTIYNHVFEEISRKEDVFTAQGRLAYVDADKCIMVPFETAGLDRLAWRTCEFIEFKKTQAGYVTKSASVPKRVVESLNEIDHVDRKHLREIGQVVRSPFFTAGGTLITEAGYNPESKTYLIDCPQMEYMGSVEDCLKYLHGIINDFPFQSNSERANFLGTWLTPLVRSMVTGPVPMTVIEANKRGTGKTKLAQIVQITYGMKPEVGDLPREEENMEKLMLSIIIEGKPIHLFDNVKHSVNSACLDRILTTGYYSGRLLGKTKNLHCEVLQLFIMTSNNTRMSEDMSRRFARVRLKTNLKNPERRSDIDKVDILSWININRGKVLSALAGLVQNWLEIGVPIPNELPRLGSFEGWRNVVGAVLWAAGEREWMQNMDEAMSESLIVDEWEQFVENWYQEIGIKANLTGLVTLCEKKGIFGGLLQGEQGKKLHNLRVAILEKRDSVIGDFRITVEKDKHTKTLVYICEKIDWTRTKSSGEPVMVPNLEM